MNCVFLRFEASRFSESFRQTLTGRGLAVPLEYLEDLEADEGWFSPNNVLDAEIPGKSGKLEEYQISCLVRKEIDREVDKCQNVWCHRVDGTYGTHHFGAVWYLNSPSVAQSSCGSCSHSRHSRHSHSANLWHWWHWHYGGTRCSIEHQDYVDQALHSSMNLWGKTWFRKRRSSAVPHLMSFGKCWKPWGQVPKLGAKELLRVSPRDRQVERCLV